MPAGVFFYPLSLAALASSPKRGDGKIGPVTQKLYDTMTGMQWGKLPDTKGWIVPVEKKY